MLAFFSMLFAARSMTFYRSNVLRGSANYGPGVTNASL